MKLLHIFILTIAGCLSICYAQKFSRIRIVSSETKEPISGATIEYSGKDMTADDMGILRLPASDRPEILVRVSAIGYAPMDTLIRFQSDGLTDISLTPQARVLEEVVVSTGYQQLPKERATGSFSFVDNQTFNEQVGTDVISRLEAVANSVQVDRSAMISSDRLLVRGLNSISGPTAPLIVLDNFPYEGSLNNINPNDIENVTILKDAAAASIWGARAGNGVIILTTKKANTGQRFQVLFNSNVRISNRPDLFYVDKISSSDYIDVENMLFDAGYYTNYINDRNRPALSPVVELLFERQNASPAEQTIIDVELMRLRGVDVRNDFNEYVYRKAVSQQYHLNILGGADLTQWNISVGYDNNVDQLHAQYRKLNLRVQHTLNPAKGLTINSSMYYTQRNDKEGVEGYGQISSVNNGLFPYAELADEWGNPLPLIKTIRQGFIENEVDPRMLDWKYYPLDDMRHIDRSSALNGIILNTNVIYSLPFGLGFNVSYQYERQQVDGKNLSDSESFFVRDLVNRYTQIDEQDELVYNVPKGGILDISHSMLQAHNLRGQFNFDKNWGKHNLSFIVGSEVRSIVNDGNSNRLYGYNSDILTYGNVNYNEPYPDYVSGSYSFIPDSRSVSSTAHRYVAMYANASYRFKERYLFSLSSRQDASNLFGLNINDKWNLLWSTGVSWDISQEDFYQISWLPHLKLRWTYGKTGNVNPDMVAVTTIQYLSNPSPITRSPYSRFSNYANPDLSWETIATMNVGIDFSSKSNRVSGSLEYYMKRGDNLYGPAPLDYTAGVGYTITRNVAGISGRGMDMDLSTRNLVGRFRWATQINLSFNKEWVTDYYLSDLRANRFVGLTNPISGVVGSPVRSMYSYKWAGLDPETGAARGYLDENVSKDYRALTGNDVLVDDLVFHGSTLPRVFGSVGNTFSYKKFFLTARFTYKFGYYFRRETVNYTSLFRNFHGHGDFMNRWREPGDELTTDVPAMEYPVPAGAESFYQMAEPFVER